MPAVGRFGRQLRSVVWRASVDDEVDTELGFHLDMLTRELIEAGMDPPAARAEAVRRFGDLDELHATCRQLGKQREQAMRRTEYLAELRQDAAYAVRQLARTPAFTAVAVFTLALGIGATTAIFSAVESVVLRPFAYAHPDRVMQLFERWQDQDGSVSVGNYVDWREQSRSFAALAAEQFSSFNLSDASTPERVSGGRVTSNFFAVFGVRPLLGRTFADEEDQPGREQVAVLSHGLWSRRYGADPRIVGREIRLGGRDHTIVGVMPATFDPSLSGEELWVPIAFTPEQRAQHDEHYLFVTGLLAPGVTRERAQAEIGAVMRRVAERYPEENTGRGVRVASLPDELVGDFRQRLFLLLGAVGFVLLIACGNVANLLLARGAARAKEIAVRAALGAGRGRIVRQLLTESVVLALASAVVGLAFAYAAVRVLAASAPEGIPRLAEARIDWAVLAFALGLASLSSIVFGLTPALRAARQDLQGVLREGGRGMGSARDRVRNALVISEVALALTLLVGAGLLIRSAIYLQSVEPGFDPSGVLTARLALPQAAYGAPEHVARTFEAVTERLATAPGVIAAAVVSQAPMGPGGGSNGLVPEGKPLGLESAIDARLRMITPAYLTAMRIPIKQGRAFNDQDVAGRERVMIVSEELARRAWPNESAIGKRIACCEGGPDDPRWKTVVGVAGDVRSDGPAADVAPEFYLPIEQVPPEAWDWVQRSMTLVARGSGDPAMLTGAMREAVRSVDPALPLYRISTMDEAIRASTADARFHTLLLASFGAMGLLLAAIGIYSVIAYFVSLRTHEIGVRMALGATTRDVLRLMTWQGLRPVLAGVALGAVASLAATRLLRGSLYGVSATDPVTFAAVAAGLIVVGLVATLIPARRATRVDPTKALQSA